MKRNLYLDGSHSWPRSRNAEKDINYERRIRMRFHKLLSLLLAAVMICCYSISSAEEDPIKELGKFNTLWDIPFGLTKEEVVQRFADEKGITLVVKGSGDDYTGYTIDETQSFSLLGYPITLSIYCNTEFSINGEKHEVSSQVYDYMSVDLENILNEKKNTEYIKEGLDQLSSVLNAFNKKYGEPTLVYYSTSKEAGSDSEYHKVDADFLTYNNILPLTKKNYSVTACIYFDNVFVMDFICNGFCSLSIFFQTSNSDYTWERIKDKFPKEEQKPDPIELGL